MPAPTAVDERWTTDPDVAPIEGGSREDLLWLRNGSGARVDTDYCVVCHTNQRKYNQTASVLGTYTRVFDDGSTEVVPSWLTEPRKYPDGNAIRDFPIMIHSIHAGEKLPVRTAASYIDEVAFPQPLGNCVACHTLNADEGNRAGPSLAGIFGRKIATLQIGRAHV